MIVNCEFCENELHSEKAHEVAGFDGDETAYACDDCYDKDVSGTL